MKQPYILIAALALIATMLIATAAGYILHFVIVVPLILVCFVAIILPSSHKFPSILSVMSFFMINSKVVELVDRFGYSTYTIARTLKNNQNYIFAYVFWATRRGPIFLETATNKVIETAEVDYIKWWFPYDKDEKIAALLINDFPDFEKLRDKRRRSVIIR